jgi:hypothetical protein
MGSRAGWVWQRYGSRFTISEDGLVATMGVPLANPHGYGGDEYDNFDYEPLQAVTCGQPMVEGRHYWEVKLTAGDGDIVAGAVRPDRCCDDTAEEQPGTEIFSINSNADTRTVSLHGNGKCDDDEADGSDGDVSHVDQGEEFVFKQGDRIGCMLDLDAGWLRFYRNGVRLRQEFTSGVTGPLLRNVEFFRPGVVVTALPGAEMPADAQGA